MKIRRVPSTRLLLPSDAEELLLKLDFEGLLRKVEEIDIKPFGQHPQGHLVVKALERLREEIRLTSSAYENGIDWTKFGYAPPVEQLKLRVAFFLDLQVAFFARLEPQNANKDMARSNFLKNSKSAKTKRSKSENEPPRESRRLFGLSHAAIAV